MGVVGLKVNNRGKILFYNDNGLNLKNIIVLTLDGKYYLGEFDEKAGGECSTSLTKEFTKIDFDRDDDE